MAVGRSAEKHERQPRVWMPKEPVQIEVIQEGEVRFLVKIFADGREERVPIVKLPRKKRYPDRPYWKWTFDKTKKKGF